MRALGRHCLGWFILGCGIHCMWLLNFYVHTEPTQCLCDTIIGLLLPPTNIQLALQRENQFLLVMGPALHIKHNKQ